MRGALSGPTRRKCNFAPLISTVDSILVGCSLTASARTNVPESVLSVVPCSIYYKTREVVGHGSAVLFRPRLSKYHLGSDPRGNKGSCQDAYPTTRLLESPRFPNAELPLPEITEAPVMSPGLIGGEEAIVATTNPCATGEHQQATGNFRPESPHTAIFNFA